MEVILVILLIIILLIYFAPYLLAKAGMLAMRRWARSMGFETPDAKDSGKQARKKQSKKKDRDQQQDRKKIFTDDEGTYIEFEEVKE